ERGQLVWNPGRAEDPGHRRCLRLRIGGVALPRTHSDLAFVAKERFLWPARRGVLPGDELDEPRHERQSLHVVRGARGIARLAEAREVADHRDRADPVVAALQTPGRDRRVVNRSIQREVELDVPLQAVEKGTRPAEAEIR